MRNERDQLIPQTREQADPYLCDPRDFEVVTDGQPFTGQCGANEREYDALLAESEKLNAKSPFTAKGEEHPNVNDAGAPHTDGF